MPFTVFNHLPLLAWLTTGEGEYTCQLCTVCGLDKEERETLRGVGLKITDRNKEAEGYEIKTSVFKAYNYMKG